MLSWFYSGAGHATYEQGLAAIEAGDFAEGYCYWKPLALQGDAETQYSLGWMYANGLGVNVDVPKAMHWWEMAARQGHQSAQFAIGLAYLNGDGVKQDDAKAMSWIIQSALAGYEDAQDIMRYLILKDSVTTQMYLPLLKDKSWFTRQVSVKKDQVNLRAGPGTSFKKLRSLALGEKLAAIGDKDGWVAIIEKDGSIAWVYASLVKTPKK